MINNLLILNYQSITDVLMFVNILQKSLSHLYLNFYFLKILLRFPIPVPVPVPAPVPVPVPVPVSHSNLNPFPISFKDISALCAFVVFGNQAEVFFIECDTVSS